MQLPALAPFFQDCLSEEDFSEMEIEIIRNTLYKAYLEDFYRFCVEELGGTTAEVMGELLEVRAPPFLRARECCERVLRPATHVRGSLKQIAGPSRSHKTRSKLS